MALEMCTLQNGQNQLGIYVIEVTYSILRFPRQQKLTSQNFMKKLGLTRANWRGRRGWRHARPENN